MPTAQTHSVALRAALTLLALLACGWLLVSWRNEQLQTDAILLLAKQPPQAAAAIGPLKRAELFNASLQPQAFIASANYILGDRLKAETELKQVLQKEPQNRTGWLLLGNWLQADDPVRAARAFARAAALNGNLPPAAP